MHPQPHCHPNNLLETSVNHLQGMATCSKLTRPQPQRLDLRLDQVPHHVSRDCEQAQIGHAHTKGTEHTSSDLDGAFASSTDATAIMLATSNDALPRYALERASHASTGSLPRVSASYGHKRCHIPMCTKRAVSRGLCRGHGGGRRCHFPGGCTKSAQSRSTFCWAHGGGQRCDAPQCMRSRKSKRFCTTHLHLEQADALAPCSPCHSGRGSSAPFNSSLNQRLLPSLGQALSAALRSGPRLPPLAPRGAT